MIKRLLWIVAFAGACVTERESVLVDRPHVEQFILDVPDRLDNSGEGSERESVVREVDVLVFNADDRLIYRSAGFDVVDDATVSSAAARKKFSVKLRGEGVNDKVVAIVNARSALVDVPADSLLAGPTRGEVLDRLAFELPGVDVIEERGVPMWGELDRTTGNGRVEEWSVIFLTRAVARVDVRVNYLKQQHFLLESVHVYNYNRAGTIAPEVGGRTNGYNPAQWRKGEGATLQPTELAAWNGGEATEPHLPDLAALADRDSPLKVSDVPL
ncbi:MAG: FimB/Mfa2 family fimbrial subunit, partial [Odoribacteraceae bacterium]|nr:FimB/Mfa2 family fimbrial subunit [Odoribacteraceae bacterium]